MESLLWSPFLLEREWAAAVTLATYLFLSLLQIL